MYDWKSEELTVNGLIFYWAKFSLSLGPNSIRLPAKFKIFDPRSVNSSIHLVLDP